MKTRPTVCALIIVIAAALAFTSLGAPPQSVALHAMPCGDLNGDGEVTLNDYEIANSFFGQSYPPNSHPADMNGDGLIDLFNDLLTVFGQIGVTTGCQDVSIGGYGSFPAAAGNDNFGSMGQFRITVGPAFRSLMSGYPGYDGVSHLTSPVMTDSATVVGRSAPHLHGSAADTSGTSVGTAGTIISDSSFTLEPAGFQGPAGSREVHTELRTLNLEFGGASVRAGTAAPSRPTSPGEVEASSGSGNPVDDWPASSFFDVFVEVDLPAFAAFPGATLQNNDPLLVVNNKLYRMPPTVVYVHGNTSAVPVVFKTTNPGFWVAGDLFGYMVLAGHGASFGDAPGLTQDVFEDIMAETEVNVGELPLPDEDADGCASGYEQQTASGSEAFGGRRSPSNPYDFYDTNGDKVIDLFNDIFDVAFAFGDDADSDPPGEPDGYDATLDRSPALMGEDVWDLHAPDGLIDLFTDIFGAAFQFGHDCS